VCGRVCGAYKGGHIDENLVLVVVNVVVLVVDVVVVVVVIVFCTSGAYKSGHMDENLQRLGHSVVVLRRMMMEVRGVSKVSMLGDKPTHFEFAPPQCLACMRLLSQAELLPTSILPVAQCERTLGTWAQQRAVAKVTARIAVESKRTGGVVLLIVGGTCDISSIGCDGSGWGGVGCGDKVVVVEAVVIRWWWWRLW